MRIISFNCEGITSAAEKGFFSWAQEQDADVICLQDIRASESQLIDAPFNPEGYFSYFFDGYDTSASQGGIALYTRVPPKAIITGLNIPEADACGLYLQADFDKISIGSLMVPEPEDSSDISQNTKYRFMDEYLQYLNKQRRKRREFITCGSWNVAHKKIDLASWRDYQESPGFMPAERAWMDEIVNGLEYVDTYREVDREGGKYTFWSNEGDREINQGRRYDYQIATPSMRHRVLSSGIYTHDIFSRHAPVIVDYEWELSF
ncbi:exodeoxyribonuclease III [Sansalvadorimonas sp. 2012CJ34-2]|uniref:Exodeoxyribonuclease III n=1 Tax=Parendozoicomonas callyspongiae TaxID=2942213 RepID=A0ABT0PEI9_9GAMM|nr:exodeoxyribonuclease III [Sansalvadorimonas sp. 2012CJ34-2]MCL6269725.1 exodeoxyribonuclease III [Sansalvadorimonas sp. 2012CJ34-2]